MIKILDMEQISATAVFGIISITSPLLGVFIGGYIADSLVKFI